MKYTASGSSNIALIKYMGKDAVEGNLPSNSSFSLTLNHLKTSVELETIPGEQDRWEPLPDDKGDAFQLKEKAQERFLNYFSKLKKEFGVTQSFAVRSTNNFPKDSGMASSASSFAGLTLAFAQYLENERGLKVGSEKLASLSQTGSGSSCRSFYSPWCMWSREEARVMPLELPQKELLHMAVVVSAKEKAVSSSDAHKIVKTSPLNVGRKERADQRLKDLIQAFKDDNWKKAYELTKSEFWDMMGLFHTSEPSFTYLQPGSIEVLNYVDEVWKTHGDGPLVTMDAGPNIHLLLRPDQKELAEEMKSQISKNYKVLKNWKN